MKLLFNGLEFELNADEVKAQFEEGVENPQIDLKSEAHIIRTSDDENAFIENVKTDARKAGIEIAIKNARNEMGLDFQGKTVENLVKAVQDKAVLDAKIEPNEKIDSLTKDIGLLKNNIENITKERDEALNGLQSYKKNQMINSTVSGLIPDNVAIPKDDMLTIISSKFGIDVNEQNQIVFSDSAGLIKNPTTLNPLTAKEVLTTFFDENKAYLKPVDGGAGGGDSSGSNGKMSVEDFNKQMTEAGISVNSSDYVDKMQNAIKTGMLDIADFK